MKYDVYVGNTKFSYDNYWDVALTKAFWKQLFDIEVVIVER